MIWFPKLVEICSAVSSSLWIGTTCAVILYLLVVVSSWAERMLSGEGKAISNSGKEGLMKIKDEGVMPRLHRHHNWFWIAVLMGYSLGGLLIIFPVALLVVVSTLFLRYVVFKLLMRWPIIWRK